MQAAMYVGNARTISIRELEEDTMSHVSQPPTIEGTIREKSAVSGHQNYSKNNRRSKTLVEASLQPSGASSKEFDDTAEVANLLIESHKSQNRI